MSAGWVKMHRELLEKGIWQCSTPEQKIVLVVLLLSVNIEPKSWNWNGQVMECQPGQLITSLQKLAEKCGNGVSVQTIRSALTKFEKFGFLTNESTKHGRLITIVNWGKYQGLTDEANKPDNSQSTDSQQTSNNQSTHQPTPTKEIRIKNKEKDNIYAQNFRIIWNHYPKKKEKAAAYKAYQARLNEGYSEEELLEATKAYAQECKDRRTAEQYIKSPKTFFGPNAPFTDYLKGDEKTDDEPEYKIAADYYRQWGYRGPGDDN